MKKKIIISGKNVHNIGYRPFLLAVAENLRIKNFFADNFFSDGNQAIYILLDGVESKIKEFLEQISKNRPAEAAVEDITQEDYSGSVMAIEAYYRYLTSTQLSKIAMYGGRMLEKQDSTLIKQDVMIEKQDSMLEKQDGHMAIVKEGFNELKSTIEQGFGELKNEHIKTRELSHEIFYAEVQELRRELGELRTMVEEIKKKVGVA